MSTELTDLRRGKYPAATFSQYLQTLIGTVGPCGYTDHALSSPVAGTATVDLAWPSPGVSLALYVRRPSHGSPEPPSGPFMASSSAESGMRQTVSFRVEAHESFEVLVGSHASRTQAYAITLTVS